MGEVKKEKYENLMLGEVVPGKYLLDYNMKFCNAGELLFRDEIVKQTLAALIGKNKPNALLIGSAGVGKTKIVENIAYRLASGSKLIPDVIKGYTVYELQISAIVSGSGLVGQLEEKLKSIINFAEDENCKAILFIDEIHLIVSDNQIYNKIAEILKPALARGKMKVIGATTLQESQKLLDNPAFNRRFSRIIVDELTREQTLEILKQSKKSFYAHYGEEIDIKDNILKEVVAIADEFHAAGNHRPDTALTLLDRTIASAIIERRAVEELLENKNSKKKAEKQKISSKKQSLEELRKQKEGKIIITESLLKDTAIRLATGNSKKKNIDFKDLDKNLSVIQGQDDVIEKIVQKLKRDQMNLFPRVKPTTMLFAGSSGVGKTEVTKIIAKELTGVDPIIINMTEYHSSASINRMIGSPAGYAGSESNAELPFDCLESNPYQVILLDEFEKCDKAVQRLFMSAFDEGYIKTNKGKVVDFSKCLIIATTNAAHNEQKNQLGFGQSLSKVSLQDEMKQLSKWFDAELLNRFEMILTFNDLSKEIYRDIICEKYQREVTRILTDNKKIDLPKKMPKEDLEQLVDESYVPIFGVRPAEKVVRKYIEEHAKYKG